MPKVLIAGCGFVGLATARLFAQRDWEVIGLTHSEESAAKLAGEAFKVMACDIGERASVEAHAHLGPFDVVVHCASSGRGGAEQYRRVYLEGARHLNAVFTPAQLLFTSSTSVYAQTDGGWVTEDSLVEPDRETGRLLRETEDLVITQKGIVARLAGIYGPGRSVLLRKFFDGTAIIEGEGAKWINQVHRDDIAGALARLAHFRVSGVFNVTDNQPLTQHEIYTWLAQRFNRPLPSSGPIDVNRKRGWTNKRVSNARLRALGWTPRYPSFFEAVASDPELVQNAGA
ncbi:MAG: NAD-dependent epimerase/dehydratase family protein [Chthoniobacter sp.]|uniref:NAD-dependent epimerase/dehydratase family protein n=1 Tax=Chthoniobacter sp. TaxID=2510640 RepID=UPI0032AB6C96